MDLQEHGIQYMNHDSIMNPNLNRFKGMTCHIGEKGFNIDMRGNIISSWWSKKLRKCIYRQF